MNLLPTSLQLEAVPRRLFFSALPTGELEFAAFICLLGQPCSRLSRGEISWSITDTTGACLASTRLLTDNELALGRLYLSAILPAHWNDSQLRVEIRADQHGIVEHWAISHFAQRQTFHLPLAGHALVAVGHRIGETHRFAWHLPAQHFAWDLLPLDAHDLRLLTTSLTPSLRAQDFVGFGQPVIAPAAGQVVCAVDGNPDLVGVGAYPEDVNVYLEQVERAAGNYVIIEHGDSVYSCLAHLRQHSITVGTSERVEAGQVIGAVGNSGFSSGPHLHLHFMDGLDLRTASPLPVSLHTEGRTHAPQAGDILTT